MCGFFKIEIDEALDGLTTCKVWRDGALVFDGVDKSALLRDRADLTKTSGNSAGRSDNATYPAK